MDTHKRSHSKGSRNAAAGRRQAGAQFNNGYRTAGGPDYRSTDWQTSDHPRGRRGIERS